jgi:hypothetical protein
MHIKKDDIPVRIDVSGAIARQQSDFGDVSGYTRLGAEYFSFGAGTDITELLHGLEGDLCQSPHWAYVVNGAITALYSDGSTETAKSRFGGHLPIACIRNPGVIEKTINRLSLGCGRWTFEPGYQPSVHSEASLPAAPRSPLPSRPGSMPRPGG